MRIPVSLGITALASPYTPGNGQLVLNSAARMDAGGGWCVVTTETDRFEYAFTGVSGATLTGVTFTLSQSGAGDTSHASGLQVHNGGAGYVTQITSVFNSNNTLKMSAGGLGADFSAIAADQFIIGTGAGTVGIKTVAQTKTILGLTVGTDVQAYSAKLTAIAALAVTDGNIIVGDGATFVAESGATARASLGLTIGTDVQAYDADLTAIAALTPTDSYFIVGNGTTWVTETTTTVRTSLGLGAGDTPAFTGITTSGQAAVALSPYSTPAGSTGELRFLELAVGGTNYVGLKGPDSVTTNKIWTLPASDGSAGQFLKTDGSGILSWGTGGGLTDISGDTTPDLGGNLNVGSFSIVDANSNELIKFAVAASAVNEITVGNAATGNDVTLSATGSDVNIDLAINAKGSGNVIVQNSSTGKFLIGSTSSSSFFSIEKQGTAKADSLFAEFNNTGNAADMDNTRTTIKWNQWYYDVSSPAADDAAAITVGTETDWTSTASTRDSYMAFFTSKGSNLGEKVRIWSSGLVQIQPNAAGALQLDPYSTAAGNTSELRFMELLANGTSYVGLKGPDSITTNTIWTLPASDGTSGQVLSTNGSKTLSWVTGGISDLVLDTTPQLGGQLDNNGFAIGDGTNELLKFSEAGGSAINEWTLGNSVTGNPVTLAATGDDSTVSLKVNAKGAGNIILNDVGTGNVGIGIASPVAYLTIQRAGTTKANTNFIRLVNTANAADMDATGTAIDFLQYYNDAIPAADNSARIQVDTETDWTAVDATRDSSVSIYVSQDGALVNRLHITSAGNVGISTSSPTSALTISPPGAGGLEILPYGSGGGQTAEFRLRELAANGTNSTGFKAPDNLTGTLIYTLPTVDGSSGQFLSTNGSGTLSWSAGAGGGGLANVVEDTSPQAGGDFDMNGFSITQGSDPLIKFTDVASGVNQITVNNAATGNNPGISATGSDTNINLALTPKAAGKLILDLHSWPNTDGTSGQTIITNGSGGLSWGTPAGALSAVVDDTSPQLGGDLDYNAFDIVDANGNEVLGFASVASAITYVEISNAATGNGPIISPTGETNVDLRINSKGTGKVKISGLSYPTADGSANAVMMTNGSAVLAMTSLLATHVGDFSEAVDDRVAVLIQNGTGITWSYSDVGNTLTPTVSVSGFTLDDLSGTNLADPGADRIVFWDDSATGAEFTFLSLGATLSITGTTLSTTGLAASGANADITGLTGLTGVLQAPTMINDANGNELFKFSATGSAVNEWTVANAATGNGPSIATTGGDTNIAANFAGKGTGAIRLGQATCAGIDLLADQPIRDSNLNELFKWTATGSAVNEFTVANAATGGNPTLSVTGGDANISVSLQSKGTGVYNLLGTADTAAEIRLFEDTDNGTNYVGLKCAASVASNVTWTLPSADGTANYFLKTNGSGTLSFAAVGIGKQTIWVPAGAMTPTVTNGCAALTSVETTSGRPDMVVLDFDQTTAEFAQFSVAFPKSWDLSTVTFQAFWTASSGTGGVAWDLQGVATSDDDTIDVVYGTVQTVTDTFITAKDAHVTAASSAITIAGTPAADDICHFRIGRQVAHASDTLTADARLIGIKLFFTTSAGTDD